MLKRALYLVLAVIAGFAVRAEAQTVRTVDIELRPYVGALKTIDLVIAGQPARLLFDTGAGLTSITPACACGQREGLSLPAAANAVFRYADASAAARGSQCLRRRSRRAAICGCCSTAAILRACA